MRNDPMPPTPSNARAAGDLGIRDIEVIRTYQHPSGAYPASPSFPPYRYAWFRDGAFIAYAMDQGGEHESAHRFHAWAVETVLRHRAQAEAAIARARAGLPPAEAYLHARYTVMGESTSDNWPNLQLDGFGTWLWALAEHVRLSQSSLPPTWEEAVALVADYLSALWPHPCHDLWEETPRGIYVYTLAAIFAGLKAASRLVAGPWADTADEVRHFVLQHGLIGGHFVKRISPSPSPSSPPLVDASLIGVAVPYRLLPPTDPQVQATIARVAEDLHPPQGGVYRYRGDTYYGGGEWVVLAAWLGWYYATVSDLTHAQELLAWVEAQADEQGFLPEQVTDRPQAPAYVAVWEQRWGPLARPLLWSHAMHLVLCKAIAANSPSAPG
ncbi:MAG: glycoside hydrolase family 15 protein [Chloroflexi bacterium]|nr:MAG: glycoside hydrolase family 15 protein [Chloroflexota bacterium]